MEEFLFPEGQHNEEEFLPAGHSDNAYDPDVNAEKLWIDKKVVKDQDCLIFMDNGNGIDFDKMHKMLSFGFSDKRSVGGHAPVGLYGNGFKSGSMRLGKDAIVFSKKDDTMCVGLLSQTYLEKIEAQNIIVPIVVFTKTGHTDAAPGYEESLHDILTHSLFNTEEELLSEFNIIDRMCTNSSGTCIIIWNLRRMTSGKLEFDFRKNDIWIPFDVYQTTRGTTKREAAGGMSVPESEYSLRAYCRILYLKPRMQIILQGENVETECVIKTLAEVYEDTYKPACLPCHEKEITITFGYNTKSAEHYGLIMYHKNRLIKAYERVACQRKANNTGEGVIGVIECDFLKPTHNKQDFDNTEDYRNTIRAVSDKLKKYWEEFCHSIKAICTKPSDNTVVQNQKLQEENRQQSPFRPTSSCRTTRRSAVISSSHTGTDSRPSDKTSVDTPDTHLPSTSTGKKRARDQNQEKPAKKKARGKRLDNIPDSPTTSQACGAISRIEAEWKGGNNVDKSTVEKEQSSEITHSISEEQQNYKVQYDQVMEEVKKLQCKVEHLENEKLTLLKDLQKEELQTQIQMKKVSVVDQGVQTDIPISSHEESETSAEASYSGRGRDSHSQQHETQDRPEIKQENNNTLLYRLRLRELRQKVARLLVTHIPALDLQQVNYDSDVIDEILTQFIDDIAPTEAAST